MSKEKVGIKTTADIGMGSSLPSTGKRVMFYLTVIIKGAFEWR